MKTYHFAIIGAAGFIAPRHMKAIKETGNKLLAVLDPYDGIGIIDSYFPDADYFSEPERFDRHLYKLHKTENKIHYVSICSPNYLHDAHIRLALRNQAHAICEKPLVLNPWNLDGLLEIENETGYRVNTILQLRLHPSIIALKEKIEREKENKIYNIDLTYITSRGKWYAWSWKGDEKKSGGIVTNIGIHFFDMLIWIFGNVLHHETYLYQPNKAAGYIELKQARVRWFLSIDAADLPSGLSPDKRTYRSITVDGEEIEFSEGFTDLHTESYRKILEGNGFGIEDARPSIELVYQIRNSKLASKITNAHPFLKQII